MAPTKKTYIYQYFKSEADKSTCKIPECPAPIIKGKAHANNLRKHLLRFHPGTIDKYENRDTLCQSKISSYVKVKKNEIIFVPFTKEEIIESAIDLVTIDGRPFSAVQDQGYSTIINKITCAWNEKYPKKRFTVNRRNIRAAVNKRAENMKMTIRKEVKNRVINMKLDCASRFSRTFLGVNIQFRTNEGELRLYTLRVIELDMDISSQSEVLAETVTKIFSDFGIDMIQLYCGAVDNGANMIKLMRLLNKQDEADMGWCTSLLDCDSDSNDLMAEDDWDMEGIEVHEEVHAVNSLFELQEKFVESVKNMCEEELFIICIRCAAHTLQLAVKDALSVRKKLIAQVRSLVRQFRAPKMYRAPRKANLKYPVISNDTRWFYVLSAALKPAAVATTMLQRPDITLNDFFYNKVAARLVKEYTKRQRDILNANTPLLAALLLDPRFQHHLGRDREKAGERHLKLLYEKVKLLKGSDEKDNKGEAVELGQDRLLKEIFDDTSAFSYATHSDSEHDLAKELQNFLNATFEEIPMKAYELDNFWRKIQKQYPILYKLYNIIASVPVTQCSVKRLFSFLKFIMNDLRGSLNSENIDNVLFTGWNNITKNKVSNVKNENI